VRRCETNRYEVIENGENCLMRAFVTLVHKNIICVMRNKIVGVCRVHEIGDQFESHEISEKMTQLKEADEDGRIF
jgi:hypothetical protein